MDKIDKYLNETLKSISLQSKHGQKLNMLDLLKKLKMEYGTQNGEEYVSVIDTEYDMVLMEIYDYDLAKYIQKKLRIK